MQQTGDKTEKVCVLSHTFHLILFYSSETKHKKSIFFFNLTLHLNLILRSVMTKSLFISFELKTAMFLRR